MIIAILSLAFVGLLVSPWSGSAQERGTPYGEWRYWGGDAWSTRYSPLDQIDADNFGDLEQAWIWRGDNFGPSVDYILRATPIYADGKLFIPSLGRAARSRPWTRPPERRFGPSGSRTPPGGRGPPGRATARVSRTMRSMAGA